MMEDKIQAFRQPLVTATGILLGFILNFMSSWVKSDVPFGDVLAGVVGVEQAAKAAGVSVQVPFAPGRVDARQDQTDVASFDVMEPVADGLRNYRRVASSTATEELLLDKAQQLTLTAPELTALVGGLRVLGANYDGSQHGVFTDTVGVLSNDFFVNLLDMGTVWKAVDDTAQVFEGRDRKTGAVQYLTLIPI